MNRPEKNEYADYYHLYIGKVPDGDILEFLQSQRDEFSGFVRAIDPSVADHRYAEGKWSVKQVIGHVCDCEWVFSSRCIWFARGGKDALPGMEQDEWVRDTAYDHVTLSDLADQFHGIRTAYLAACRGFDDETWMRKGNASGFDFSVRAFPWILAGHVMHHTGVLRERYL